MYCLLRDSTMFRQLSFYDLKVLKTDIITNGVHTALAISNIFGLIVKESSGEDTLGDNFAIVMWLLIVPLVVKIYLKYFDYLKLELLRKPHA